MDIEFLNDLQQLLKEQPNSELEITLDDGSTFTTSHFEVEQYENGLILVGVAISSSPSELAFFLLSRIHHTILKSRHKKKISFRLEDLPFPSNPQELPEKNPENTDK